MEEDRCRACDVITIVEHFVFGNESGFRPILSLSQETFLHLIT